LYTRLRDSASSLVWKRGGTKSAGEGGGSDWHGRAIGGGECQSKKCWVVIEGRRVGVWHSSDGRKGRPGEVKVKEKRGAENEPTTTARMVADVLPRWELLYILVLYFFPFA